MPSSDLKTYTQTVNKLKKKSHPATSSSISKCSDLIPQLWESPSVMHPHHLFLPWCFFFPPHSLPLPLLCPHRTALTGVSSPRKYRHLPLSLVVSQELLILFLYTGRRERKAFGNSLGAMFYSYCTGPSYGAQASTCVLAELYCSFVGNVHSGGWMCYIIC